MKTTKQIIERKLKFSQKYIYLDIIRGSIESGQVSVCDNCGKLITNMVKVAERESKRIYYIGTDCAQTLSTAKCLYNNGQDSDFYLDIYSYNITAKFATELNKGKKYTFDGLFCHVENDKGKSIQCSKTDLAKFYPELIQK